MLKILGRPTSINVRKVQWLCDEMALPYALELWGIGHRAPQDPAFLALNPHAMVPVLVDDGQALWESNALCRYLADRQQRADLLPAPGLARARVEQWMDWQATELNNAWRYAFMHHVRRSPAHADPAAVLASESAWNRQMAVLDAQLAATGAFVVGTTFTLADIVIGLSVHRWLQTPIAHAALPAVAAYHARLCARPAFGPHGPRGAP